MPAPTLITDVVADGLGRLTSMYSKQPNIRKILTALLTPRQETENMLFSVYGGRALRTATLYTLPTTNAILDAIGALVGQPRNGMSDAAYQGVLFLKVAVNRSTGRTQNWAKFATILLMTSGGGVENLEGTAAFDFGVFDMTLPPIAIAGVLTNAVPNGVRGALIYSTWAQSLNFEWGSSYSGGAGHGGFGSVYASATGGLLVAAQPLSLSPDAAPSNAAFSPAVRGANLALWLSSDLTTMQAVGGVITVWRDQSPNAYAAVPIGAGPTLTPSSGAYNNQPVTTWLASSAQQLLISSFVISQPNTIYIVCDESVTGANVIYGGGGGQIVGRNPDWYMYSGLAIHSGNSTAGPHAIAAVFDGTTSSLYIDSSSTPTVTGDTDPSGMTGLFISSSGPITGNIAEIVIVEGIDGPAERAQMFAYFATKFAGAWA